MSRRRGVDVLLALTLAMWGFALASAAMTDFRAAGGRPFLQQPDFGPAVLAACGHGYQNPDDLALPPVRAFLTQERAAFDCGELPATVPTRPLRAFQRVSRYLELTVAAVWKLDGVSWQRIDRLNAAAFGLALMLLFILCRFVAGRVLSTLAAIAWGISPLHLTVLVDFRDYVKAPFVLAAVLLTAWMIRSSHPRRAWLAAGAALVAGIGAGFRTDVLLVIVPVALAAALAATTRLVSGVAVAAMCIAIFIAAAFPILRGYKDGAVIPHVVLLGLAAPFDARLGLETPVYRVAPVYHDWYAIGLMQAWIAESDGADAGRSLTYATPEYDAATLGYLNTIARHIPADLMLRAMVSAARSVTVMFTPPYVRSPHWLTSSTLRRAIDARGALTPVIVLVVPVVLIASAAMLFRLGWRKATAIISLALMFPALSVLQFHERHVFYFEVLPLLAMAATASGMRRVVAAPRALAVRMRSLAGALLGVAAAIAVVTVVLAVARRVQARQLTALFASYESMPAQSQRWIVQPRGSTALATLEGGPNPTDLARFNAVDFDRERCGAGLFRATVRYRRAHPVDDFSFDMWVNLLGSARERLVFPSVSAPSISTMFEGLELPADAAACVSGWSILDPAPRQPWLIARLPSDWRSLPLRQGWEDGTAAGIRHADGYVYFNRPERSVRAAVNGTVNSTLEALPGGPPHAYLLRSEPAQVTAAHTFVIEGEAGKGNFVVGLQMREQWTETIVIPRAGRFLVFLRPPADGEYRVVVADGGEGGEHAIALSRAGWFPPSP